ncbi:uncharacterized protein LOC135685421 [Rhopilema esculentum]|uniref:uncharacterized protein LOC135685421 n=1 Tax=Rhopilema esculentum TaxID=499914 RepID=UPI0031DDC4E3
MELIKRNKTAMLIGCNANAIKSFEDDVEADDDFDAASVDVKERVKRSPWGNIWRHMAKGASVAAKNVAKSSAIAARNIAKAASSADAAILKAKQQAEENNENARRRYCEYCQDSQDYTVCDKYNNLC